MEINHQYEADSSLYSGATELFEKVTWTASGIFDSSSHVPISATRRGSLVTISGLALVSTTLSQGTDLAFLPEVFRPTEDVVIMGYTTNSNSNVVFYIQPNGRVINDSRSLSDYFFLNGTYSVG